jgi:hypothetical protein
MANIRQVEDLLNQKLAYVIENLYSEYEPGLIPLADGTVKDGLIDTGDLLLESFFTLETDFSQFPPKLDIVLNTTNYFKWVDGGTEKMAPRNVLRHILEDDEVKSMIGSYIKEQIILREE